jgi:para-nitrobenzyl esterase
MNQMMMCKYVSLVLLNIFCMTSFAITATPTNNSLCNSQNPEIVCTESGAVRGSPDGATLAFKAIPYAAPPVGALRWRPPAQPVAWTGIRDGSSYGASCPQLVENRVEGQEDCLFINVWRPTQTPTKPLPVMIWLTGGGNHVFSGAGSFGFGKVVYNGRALVPNDVIVVTYNLRLGVFGFLAHPALDQERVEKVSGNYGSLDQVEMLRWVNRNIAAFGGDPSRVFLFGTSAGGGNICALLTSPLTTGLIHGVAMQSSVPIGCELQTLADAQNGTGAEVTKRVGCVNQADTATCLREKSVNELVSALPGTFTVFPRLYGPNVDGVVFPQQPIERIQQKNYPPVPIIIGDTKDETMQFVNSVGPVTDGASYSAAIARVFGMTARDQIIEHYPLSNYPTPRAAFVQVTTDAQFTCQSRRLARTFASVQQPPVYRYVFAHSLENDPTQKALGAIHTIEHPFLFNWEGSYQPTAIDRKIQSLMLNYWSNMAKLGNPNGANAVTWTDAGKNGDTYLEISAASQVRQTLASTHCDFWDTVKLPQPHL